MVRRDECGEEGRAPRPFIGLEGGAGWPDGEGDRAAGGGGINDSRPVRWGGETEGEWGVKRGGECSTISGRGGNTGEVRLHARGSASGCAVGCQREKKLGRAHAAVIGEGGGRLGQLEAKA
jgi:hypothetical protein